MTQTINNVQGATDSDSQPGATTNITASILAAEASRMTNKKYPSTRGKPKKEIDSCQEETDCRALERAENEGMTR